MKIYVDIDGTICETPYTDDKWDYKKSIPTQSHVNKINKLYDEGNKIIYWTARENWKRVEDEDKSKIEAIRAE